MLFEFFLHEADEEDEEEQDDPDAQAGIGHVEDGERRLVGAVDIEAEEVDDPGKAGRRRPIEGPVDEVPGRAGEAEGEDGVDPAVVLPKVMPMEDRDEDRGHPADDDEDNPGPGGRVAEAEGTPLVVGQVD